MLLRTSFSCLKQTSRAFSSSRSSIQSKVPPPTAPTTTPTTTTISTPSSSSLNEWSSYKVSIYRVLAATLLTTLTLNFIREKLSFQQFCINSQQHLKDLESQVQQHHMSQLDSSHS